MIEIWRALHRHKTFVVLAALVLGDGALLIWGPRPVEHQAAITAALAAGEKPDWWHDAAMGIHYGAWIGLAGWILLTGTHRIWARGWERAPSGQSADRPISSPRWFWPLVLMAMLAGLGLRLPMASRSLWWDEAWAVQQASHGKWKEDPKKPDGLRFLPHDWKRCAFYYQKPTNHVPLSLAQKTSLTVWQKITKAKREDFSDLAARMPALLAAAAAVLLMACLLRTWGHPGAGVAAALVLAVHPWAIRYGVDTRAYSLILPLCPAAMLAATAVIRSHGRSTGGLVALGGAEFLWLWAFPNALVDVAVLNLVTLVFLLRVQETTRDRWTAWWRLLATNLFAALLLTQVFLPNVLQARRWAGAEKDHHVLTGQLLDQTASNLLSGLDHYIPSQLVEATGIPALSAHGLTAGTLALVIAGSVLYGAWRALVRDHHLRWVLPVTFLVSASVFAALTQLADSYFYPRFIIAVLPCLILLTVQAMSELSIWLGKRPGKPLASLPALAVAALYGWVVYPGWQLLLTHPIEPLHDVASFIQKHARGLKPAPVIVCYGLGKEAMPLYERHCLPAGSGAELAAIVAKAEKEKRPLYAIYGYANFNRTVLAEGFKQLDDKSLFTEVAAFPGIEPDFYFRILKRVDVPR
ncbi:hypothetical protein [Verrucomicrobium sp. BvORR034]|uniref:hypothetical protein n=1 Tax=Verrucomicrobium sp. BvORR034 TaxID=1396418 RepID=UPI000678BA8B|nr:hypothetical protein [Verrucomicrobium sp. BvORR034]